MCVYLRKMYFVSVRFKEKFIFMYIFFKENNFENDLMYFDQLFKKNVL